MVSNAGSGTKGTQVRITVNKHHKHNMDLKCLEYNPLHFIIISYIPKINVQVSLDYTIRNTPCVF